MTVGANLERSHRLWLKWYPKWFRREYEAEILDVLMAGARDRQCGSEAAEYLALMTSGLRMRLQPRVPRADQSVLAAIRLMYVGAVLELAAAMTILITIGDVRSNVVSRNPGFSETNWHGVVTGQIEPTALAAILAVGFWLWMAWSIGRGHCWVRVVFTLFFGLNLFGLLNGLFQGSAVYARPDLAIGSALCLFELVTLAVIFRVKIAPTQPGAVRML